MMSARIPARAPRPPHRRARSRLAEALGLSAVGLAVAATSGWSAARHAPAHATAHATPRPAPTAAQGPDGRQIFSTTCASCHQVSGEGVEGTYPPLAGSEWATGRDERIVRILLHGLTGPVEVAGETYSGAMPPWGGTLKDAELAAVATYVRGSWGNKASAITPATVARIRAATVARRTPWTAAELAQIK